MAAIVPTRWRSSSVEASHLPNKTSRSDMESTHSHVCQCSRSGGEDAGQRRSHLTRSHRPAFPCPLYNIPTSASAELGNSARLEVSRGRAMAEHCLHEI